MAFDEKVAERIRPLLLPYKNHISEQHMFGGLAFLYDRKMTVGIMGDRLVAKIGQEEAAHAHGDKNVTLMDFTGKPIKSMVYVSPEGYESDEELEKWVELSIQWAKVTPAKAPTKKRKRKRTRKKRKK